MGPGLRRLLGVTVFVLLLAAALVAAPAQALSPPDVFPPGIASLRDLSIGAQRTSSGRLDLSFPAPCAPLRC
jgi:hypothetical protein